MTDETPRASGGPEIERSSVQVTRPREGVALITLVSRPLGVLRNAVKRALKDALVEQEADPGVRCVVLTGTDRAFSVGSDIRDFRQSKGWLIESEHVENDLNGAVEASRLPVIAACNGHTLGGGAVLALACDLRLAAESAHFGFPEVKVAAFASGSGTQRLPRLVGHGRAMDLLLTGRIIDASEALKIGLVEFVVPDDELLERALVIAAEIAAKPAAAIAASKRCVNVGLRDGIAAGLALELELAVEMGLTEDAAEGQAAFMEKREPRFGKR